MARIVPNRPPAMFPTVFKAGHTYTLRDGGNEVLCVSVNTRTAAFRTSDSFSIKSLDKAELYADRGVKNWKHWIYKILG